MTVLGERAISPAVAVEVVGALDLSCLARVRAQIDEELSGHPEHLVVDLSACPFVDASALSMLLEVHRQASRAGGALTLRGCSPRVLRLLSLTGLRRVFDLEPASGVSGAGVSGAAR